jgi:hypothetical protein
MPLLQISLAAVTGIGKSIVSGGMHKVGRCVVQTNSMPLYEYRSLLRDGRLLRLTRKFGDFGDDCALRQNKR